MRRIFACLLIAATLFADEPRRYALALYHFNVEYVAGTRSAEDAVVTESFVPLLDMYLRHPDWGGDIELQGYMIEVMAERHPEALEKLRQVAASGKVEIVCCHYSDQLVLAFPRTDLEEGLDIDWDLFDKHRLPRCGVIFFQEGQFGEGLLACLKGYRFRIAIAADGTYDWWQPEDKSPLLESRGVLVVPGDKRVFDSPGGTHIEVEWAKLGDGERVATGSDPYALRKPFHYDPKVLGAYETYLSDLEKRGNRIVSVTQYVQEIRGLGVKPTACKPCLDSPWKGDKCQNVYLWMGRHDQPFEDDVGVHTGTVKAREEVLRAECEAVLAKRYDPHVLAAWKHLLRSEVTDATGWVPLPSEVQYGRDQAEAALKDARSVPRTTKVWEPTLGREFVELGGWLDTRYARYEDIPEQPERVAVEHGPIELRVHGTVSNKVTWAKLGDDDWEARVTFTLRPWKLGHARVVFASTLDEVRYSPAGLDEEIVSVPWGAIKPDHAYLALANGLIGVGDDLWVVQDHREGFSSCRVSRGEASFEVEGGSRLEHDWRFLVIHGRERAIEAALRANVWPILRR